MTTSTSTHEPARLPGTHIFGYVFAESGVGQHTRLLVRTVRESGAPYRVTPFTDTQTRQEAEFDDFGNTDAPCPIHLVSVNADELPRFVSQFREELAQGFYTIGLWAWELEDFPEWMARSGQLVDEVWANSRFSAQSIARAIDRPVYPFPLPVEPPRPADMTRNELGLPEDRFLFLFCFDFNSVFERKNPLAVVKAFRQAFAEDEGPELVIKTINADLHPDSRDRLFAAAADRRDIQVFERYVPLAEHHALVAACDAYVSLHRSEGFGLTLAEAMALGKPVIGTAYSGNLDFMTEDNSYLVPATLVAIPEGCDPYPAGNRWGQPDVQAAAEAMRHVFENPNEAREKAERGRQDILRDHGPRARANFVRERLQSIGEQLPRERAVLQSRGNPAWRRASALVERGPDLHMSSPLGPLAYVLRKGIFRVLQNYHLYQHEIHRASLEALSESQAAIDKRFREREQEHEHRHLALESRLVQAEHRMERQLQQYEEQLQRLEAVQQLQQLELGGTAATPEDIQQLVDFREKISRLGDLEARVEQLLGRLEQIQEELSAPPYLAEPSALYSEDEAGRTTLAFDHAHDQQAEHAYRSFEDLFRGEEAFIRDRQRRYVDLCKTRAPVLDFGCGRGEMLDLLAANGVEAYGVDLDQGMVERCRAKGHRVIHGDGLAHLESVEDGSLGAIFSAQVIEHLGTRVLEEVLRLARRKLRPEDGLLIAETVNPHSFRAFKAFWVDPTHQTPLFPETVLALTRFAGFSSGRIVFPNGTGDWERDRRTEGEYALLASRAPSAPTLPNSSEEAR